MSQRKMIPLLPFKVTRGLEVIAKIDTSTSKGTRLVVKMSEKVSNVIVYKVQSEQDNYVLMAFCFMMGSKMYYPVVERDSATKEVCVKVVGPETEPYIDLPRMFLFRWDTNGEYGSLYSVAEPNQYLSVSGGKVITLSHSQTLVSESTLKHRKVE